MELQYEYEDEFGVHRRYYPKVEFPYDSKDHCEELNKRLTNDCQALANRCFVLTQGSMCCFCELNEFRCPHAWSYDRKIKAAMELMEESKNA